jgi:hypothetical protein
VRLWPGLHLWLGDSPPYVLHDCLASRAVRGATIWKNVLPCADLHCAAGARQVGLALVASALQNHLTVFAALDPLREGLVTCTGTDAACAARLAQPLPDVCGLERAAWRWTDECGLNTLPSPPYPGPRPTGC